MKRQQGPLWGPDAPQRPPGWRPARRRPRRQRGHNLMMLGSVGFAIAGFACVILLSDASIAAESPSNHISMEGDVYPWLLVPVFFLALTVGGALIAWLDRRDEQV